MWAYHQNVVNNRSHYCSTIEQIQFKYWTLKRKVKCNKIHTYIHVEACWTLMLKTNTIYMLGKQNNRHANKDTMHTIKKFHGKVCYY